MIEYKANLGVVYIVGAGPGDLQLISIKGKSLIEQADALIYDNLINDKLLNLIKKGCDLKFVGKSAGKKSIKQEEINKILVEEAKLKKIVVRLKGGDSMIFSRIHEEIEALESEKISYEIVPGVTSASACAAYAGIPLTQRSKSSSIIFLTGQEDPEKEFKKLNLKAYAKSNSTLCIYMFLNKIDNIIEELINGGLKKSTNVLVVENGSRNSQRSFHSNLNNIKTIIKENEIKSPAICFIGDCLSLKKNNWFENRPLHGKNIGLPVTLNKNSNLSVMLQNFGANVFEMPIMDIKPYYNKKIITEVFSSLTSYDWIIFTSSNAVKFFFELLIKTFKDIRSLGIIKIAVIGKTTELEVNKYNLKAEVVSKNISAKGLAEHLVKEENLENRKILSVIGNKNSKLLNEILENKGRAIVDNLQIYENKINNDYIINNSSTIPINLDAIIFTSSSMVDYYCNIFKSMHLKNTAFGSIGPKTTKTLIKRKMDVAFQANISNLENLLVETISYFNKKT